MDSSFHVPVGQVLEVMWQLIRSPMGFDDRARWPRPVWVETMEVAHGF